MSESPIDVARRYTQGLDYPASKEQVLDALERNRAPHDVVEIIRSKHHPRFAIASDLHMLLYHEASLPRGAPAERDWGHWRPAR